MERDMPERAAVLAPKRYQVLSGSALKVIAVVSMFIDHFTHYILPYFPHATDTLWTFRDTNVTWLVLGSTIGRIAFPIFCFLLVEGFVYTKDRVRYGLNLFVFALISEMPFDLERTLMVVDPTYQNVFWTLLLSYLGLCALEHMRGTPAKRAAVVIGLALLSMSISCDYGPRGYAMVLVLYALRHKALEKTVIGSCITYATWRAGLAFIPINLYNGKRGFIKGLILKYAFYAFYPAHLLFLYWLRLQLGI